MRVTKYSHACVRIEHDGAVLVIDPGVWSEAEEALDGVDAVLLTHEHADHVDADRLADALAKRPNATVYTHPAVIGKFAAQWGGGAATAVHSGQSFVAAGLPVRAFGGLHAVIHPEIPRVPNLGYLIDEKLYHPGDSFDVPGDATVETLFVPVAGPWLKLAESIDFVRAVGPQRVYALHDCLDNERSAGLVDGHLKARAGCPYERLTPGTAIQV
ncbi:MBL fold metallo-hydrolase [Allorhizocola rhizosphaerae]|uniref:MBL fold metallo-hydrolase n=1 Tax=Allorhizocola rhizosphaerae TaxID=1872709 RepID=UPI0013C2FDE5